MAMRNPNVLARTAVTWIKGQMKDALDWIRFSKIVKQMHILEGWPDQAHTKMQKLLRAIADDGILEENIGESPLCFRLTGKYYAMSTEAVQKYIVERTIPTKSPWRENSHFKDSSNKKVDVPAWMDDETFHKEIVKKQPLPVIEQPKRKKDIAMPPQMTPMEITTARDIVQERIGFQTPTVAGPPVQNKPSLQTPNPPSTMTAITPNLKDQIEGIVHAAMLDAFSDEGKMIESRLMEKIDTLSKEVEDRIVRQIGKSGKLPVIHRIEYNEEAIIRSKTRGHYILKKATQAVAAGCNVLLIGPEGCGKTTVAKHIGKLLKCDAVQIHNSQRTSPYIIRETNLVCFQNVHLYGKEDLNWLLRVVEANPKTKFVATMNPVDIPEEVRMVFSTCRLKMSYDQDIESQICPDPELLQLLWAIRDAEQKQTMLSQEECPHLIFNTRAIADTYKLITGAGWTLEEVCEQIFTGEGHTETDKRTILRVLEAEKAKKNLPGIDEK